MKQLVCLVCTVSLFISSFAQTSSLYVTTNKTTSLVFPRSIRHVDRGSSDIMVQQVAEADNILLVKAASKEFSETNLTVVTSDGSVYDFAMNYDANPLHFVYTLPVTSATSIATYANSILDNPKTINGITVHKGDVWARIAGIYIKNSIIFFEVKFYNESSIDYDIDFMRFYIRDKKQTKRTAIQENELKPLYVSGNTTLIKAKSRSAIVVALDKFTIPDAKYFAVQIMENNGGRHLFMRVSNTKIIKAIALPDLK